ncbi:LVIVD repeat-containing protein [Negadavirga shengliensis]|uniref:LVIVD repeat-containing protein n=1 Tax=Negadavirga shengliensis TaxID=1389218 RepID=A0ABV9T3G7_9BACT
MKTKLLPLSRWTAFLFLPVLVVLSFTSCEDEVETTYTYRTQVPLFLEVNTFREADILIEPGKPLDNPGKIYIYGDYLLISEPDKGIHILDNTNPATPKNINFINIPGTMDLAINSNVLYADNYVDLLAFDITNPKDIKLLKREEDVFPNLYSNEETGTIVVYKDTLITSTQANMHLGHWGRPATRLDFFANASGMESRAVSQNYGQGGSMARFTLLGGHLYAVDDNHLRIFNVELPDDPKFTSEILLGWGIETIFPFKDKLFIGSMTGMHIYDASTPSDPKKMAEYQHITACDPVVVNDEYAFVTLRSGTGCRMGIDELHVLDIINPYQPVLLKKYPMENPHGLGLAGDYLYIAEGKHGLKSFNVSNVFAIGDNLVEHLKDLRSVDIIPGPKSLIVIGPDGVCQFDYTNPEKLKKLSCINVTFR